ncbi:MAG: chromosome segregation protein SMC [bacterium]|jgi:chromosome segregation protein
MLLRRLELYGFKSFANRTKLEFGPGITAIVGPNGSGKSNIADAIRWVLGEQRLKTLRGEKTEDLIFAGSAKRPSLGYGEVVLVLDNSSGTLPLEYAEVEISRRVYRSGESEFRLNKARCRLKDIQELFLDTGLGRDTYALISQGQVENLLTVGPEERRLMLEEAAGILKYRYRKGEVLHKLEDAERNIQRVGDLLAELERQLPVLQEEARREKLYRRYSEELRTGQITLALYQWERLQERRKEILQQLREEEDQKQGIMTRLQTLGAELEEIALDGHLTEEQMRGEQQNLASIQAQSGRLEESIALREERLKLVQEEQVKKEKQQETRAERRALLDGQKKEAAGKLALLEQESLEVEKELLAAEGSMNRYRRELAEKEEGLETYRDEAIELVRLQAEAKNEWQLLQNRRESIENSRLQLNREVQDIETELSALNKKYLDLDKEGQKWDSILVAEQRALADLEKERETIRVKWEKLEGEIRQKQGELDKVCARRQLLEEMERGHEGYHRGVRTVLKGFGNGIWGTVAGLIQVEKDLEQAIGVALGPMLQFLVVENDSIAQEAIEFLQAKKEGRATFLPLNTVRGEPLSGRGRALLSLPGVLGRAADLVTAETRVRPVVESLLGRVIVVKDLTTARMVARQGGFRYKIVTLGGELIAPGGAITGGTLGTTQINLLSRKREIKELKDRRDSLDREVQDLIVMLESVQKIMSDCDSRIQETREKMRQGKPRLEEIKREQEDLHRNSKRGKETLQTLQWELKTARETAQELDRQIKLQEEKLVQLQEEGEAIKEKITDLEGVLRGNREGQVRQQENLTGLRVQRASLAQQIKAQQDYLEQLEYQYLELEKTRQEEEQELVRLREEEKELTDKLETDSATLEELRCQEAVVGNRLRQLQEKREEIQQRQGELQKKVGVQQQELAAATERMHQLERNQTKLETSLEEVERRMFEDYGLTAAQAREYKEEALPEGQWRRRVAELKEILAQLGNVNLQAGEQYREVQERYDFLIQQQQDLVEARRSLDKLLREIDAISRERLEETFLAVQDSFQRVFQELFGGGKAQLQFTEGENLLEAGLEIMVQPPGKKLQNLLLLSGGEKALAAIAFLFGILQVKPSPFCVLDEIDASLDDTNAVRLGKFLRRYAQDTQFLLISHRQEVIRQADVLYGITMDESGVSQFLSLAVEDYKVG